MILIFAPPPKSNSLWHYCMARGWEDIHVVTSLDELLRTVRAGRVEILLASKLAALGRSSLEFAQVLGELVAHKTVLIVPGQGLDTSKVPGDVILKMLDAIEEFKHAAATESVREGLAVARRRGVRLGRPPTKNVHREDVKALRAQGMTGRAIGKELGIPSSTVFKLIGECGGNI